MKLLRMGLDLKMFSTTIHKTKKSTELYGLTLPNSLGVMKKSKRNGLIRLKSKTPGQLKLKRKSFNFKSRRKK